MTTKTTPDGRPVPQPRATERDQLEAWLDFHRETLALKCAGLTDEQLRTASVPPSPMTLLGLVQHLAEIERNWFRRVFSGQDLPALFGDGEGFTLSPDRGIDEVMAAWRTEIERGRELIALASPDDCGPLPELPGPESDVLGDQGVSLRWIMIHMIEEYARHNGHADLIRERVDGTAGV
ncbi:DinB family protein [Streptomyces sp. J2-1]|uniref:DinB family protein n=1 Tax=Streptomyces corallincola TaxID=2851888 RepID=UPI001C389C52|nr:DinB family protein [Streptomyces corallincola]MBV2356116.1 DinB family protein [Streptomyces corallincola]